MSLGDITKHKEIISNYYNTNSVQQRDAITLICDYVFDKKQTNISVEHLNACASIFGLETMFMSAVHHYSNKYCLVKIHSKGNVLLGVRWQ